MLLIALVFSIAYFWCCDSFRVHFNPKVLRTLLPARKERPLPTVSSGKDQSDVISFLVKDRILFLGSEVNDEVANNLVAQMLYLAADNPREDITLYINSPGGSVQAGLAIFDTMQYVSCDIATVSVGMSASMGAFLLSAGTKGKRRALPNSRIMIHQPLGGTQGEASDMEVSAKLLLHTKRVLNHYLAHFCEQPLQKIEIDTDRDFYMTSQEALQYGLIDSIVQHKMMPIPLDIPSLQVQPLTPYYNVGSILRG